MKGNTLYEDAQTALINNCDFLKEVVTDFLQRLLNEQFASHIGAEPYERTEGRKGQRNGSYARTLKMRVGSISLSVPRDREGAFRTELFERYQRTEKALTLTMAEMYLKGVSTRKVSAIVEELCGEGVSKSQVSELTKQLDEDFREWRERSLNKKYEYLLFDAIYLKVREGGCVESRAALICVGVDEEGHRDVIGCRVTTGEYKGEWKEFIRSLKKRGVNTPRLVISDDHDGLREAIGEEFGCMWQRCQVHYMRNFIEKLSRKRSEALTPRLRVVFQALDMEGARRAKATLIDELLEVGLNSVAEWIDETVEDCLNVLNIPEKHQKKMASTNMLERVNEEIRRRTRVIRIFPNRESSLRIVTSVCQERSEAWEGRCYLTMKLEEADGAASSAQPSRVGRRLGEQAPPASLRKTG